MQNSLKMEKLFNKISPSKINRTIVNPCYDYSSLTYIQCLVPCCFKVKNNDNATASLIRGTICFS